MELAKIKVLGGQDQARQAQAGQEQAGQQQAGQVGGEEEGTQNPGVETGGPQAGLNITHYPKIQHHQKVEEWLVKNPSTYSDPATPPRTTARKSLFGTPLPLKKRKVVETQPEDSDFESILSPQNELVQPPGEHHHVPDPMDVDPVAVGGRSLRPFAHPFAHSFPCSLARYI